MVPRENTDICIIGHITQDHIEIQGEAPQIQAGGTVYYSSITTRRLGLNTSILTKLKPSDRDTLLSDLVDLGIRTRGLPSTHTTRFVNSYPARDSDQRTQRVTQLADPFSPEELDAQARVYLFGPLTRSEITPECIQSLKSRGGCIGLELQGLLRLLHGERVMLARNESLADFLRHVDVLKASQDEAFFATGATTIKEAARILSAMGPGEVLVTSGSKGSMILHNGKLIPIPAYPPPRQIDTTGCGDTYFAAYLTRRLLGSNAEQAGHFAAGVAAAKIAYYGAFRGIRPKGISKKGTPTLWGQEKSKINQLFTP